MYTTGIPLFYGILWLTMIPTIPPIFLWRLQWLPSLHEGNLHNLFDGLNLWNRNLLHNRHINHLPFQFGKDLKATMSDKQNICLSGAGGWSNPQA